MQIFIICGTIHQQCGEEPSVEAADSPVLPDVQNGFEGVRVALPVEHSRLHWRVETVVLNSHADEVPGVCCQTSKDEKGRAYHQSVSSALEQVCELHKEPELHLASEERQETPIEHSIRVIFYHVPCGFMHFTKRELHTLHPDNEYI